MDEPGRADCDLICLGAGIGGLTAAITAHELGLRPLVIEKTGKIGGVGGISGGQCWMPVNQLARAAGITDSVEAATAYLMYAGGGFGDEQLARHYCARAGEVVKFLADKAGLNWVLVPVPDNFAGCPGAVGALESGRLLEVHVFPGALLGADRTRTRRERNFATATEVFTGSVSQEEIEQRRERDDRARGGALAGALVRNALDRGIEIWTNSSPVALLREDGRVVGVRVARADAEIEVRASRGVLLATGGTDGSAELTRIYEGRDRDTVSLLSTTGDHLRLAGLLGAKVVAPFRPIHTCLEPDVTAVLDEDGTVQRNLSIMRSAFPHAIIVNSGGRRFHNEADHQSRDAGLTAIDTRAPWSLANVPCWTVWDSQHVQKYFGGVAPDTPGVWSAASLPELATAAGIDPDGLARHVAEFNRHAAAGRDPDFGRGSHPADRFVGDFAGPGHPNLGAIDQPPFYAVRLAIRTMGIPVAGLTVDEHSRVIDWADRPIRGLYAAGNAIALVDLGFGYEGGNANGRSLVYGFGAAAHAASPDSVTDAACD
jgi:3-oxosteroid 1-dehydrogenase